MVSGCKKASGSALPFKERLKIAVLLAQGMSLSAVANKVECTVPTVRKWAKRSAQGSLDVLPRSGRPKKWGAKKKSGIIQRIKGKRWRQERAISRQTGVPKTTVRNIVREYRLKKFRVRSRFILPMTAIKRRRQFAAEFLKNKLLLQHALWTDECHFYLRHKTNSQNDVIYDTDSENVPVLRRMSVFGCGGYLSVRPDKTDVLHWHPQRAAFHQRDTGQGATSGSARAFW